MNPVSNFLEKLGSTMPPLKKLQESVKANVIHSFKSQSVQEMYGKWRRNLCEWCEECFGENGYSGHKCTEMGHGDFIFIFNEGRDDELLALVKPMYKPSLDQQNSAYPSIPMTKEPPKQQPSENWTNHLNNSNLTTLTPLTLTTKCIEDTNCEDSGVNEEIKDKSDMKFKEEIKGISEEHITVHEEKYQEEYSNMWEKEEVKWSKMGKKHKEIVSNKKTNKKYQMKYEELKKKWEIEEDRKRREKRKKVRNRTRKERVCRTAACGGTCSGACGGAWGRSEKGGRKWVPWKKRKKKERKLEERRKYRKGRPEKERGLTSTVRTAKEVSKSGRFTGERKEERRADIFRVSKKAHGRLKLKTTGNQRFSAGGLRGLTSGLRTSKKTDKYRQVDVNRRHGIDVRKNCRRKTNVAWGSKMEGEVGNLKKTGKNQPRKLKEAIEKRGGFAGDGKTADGAGNGGFTGKIWRKWNMEEVEYAGYENSIREDEREIRDCCC